MISLNEARLLISERIRALAVTPVPLARARGRVLGADVVADGFYPSGDRAQMDGYVVRADAVPGAFRLAGEVPAGAAPTRPVEPGETFRIFTGALVPPQGGRVVMQEDSRRDGEWVELEKFGERLHVRAKGSEASPGDVVLPAGTRLGAVELAILAQLGTVTPTVVPAPVIHHVATGGELVDPTATPGPGQIRDTNTTLLRALFADLGATEFTTTRAPDDLDALVQAADTAADLLIVSGGASVGDYDFGAAALRKLGYAIHFDRVNLRPGKPLTFATRGEQAAFVLPGNPVSHFVCFHTAVRLAVEIASGHPPSWPTAWLPMFAGAALTTDQRETWWPARASISNGMLSVAPKRWSTSGDTFSLVRTNALVLVNSDSPRDGRALTLLLEAPGA